MCVSVPTGINQFNPMAMQNAQMSQAPMGARAPSPMNHPQQMNMSSVPAVRSLSPVGKIYSIFINQLFLYSFSLSINVFFCHSFHDFFHNSMISQLTSTLTIVNMNQLLASLCAVVNFLFGTFFICKGQTTQSFCLLWQTLCRTNRHGIFHSGLGHEGSQMWPQLLFAVTLYTG